MWLFDSVQNKFSTTVELNEYRNVYGWVPLLQILIFFFLSKEAHITNFKIIFSRMITWEEIHIKKN